MATRALESDTQQKQHERQVTKESLLANDYDWIIEPQRHKHQQTGGLLLGNIKLAENQKQLKRYHIGAVVSVFGEKSLFINPNIKHFRILISDNARQNIKCFFNSSNKFIEQNIAKTNVYIHCHAGVSRSPTIVAAYMMKQKKMAAETALQQIKKKRKHICPNRGFVKQLHQYEKQLREQHISDNSLCEIM